MRKRRAPDTNRWAERVSGLIVMNMQTLDMTCFKR
jgi:hypothetical protein